MGGARLVQQLSEHREIEYDVLPWCLGEGLPIMAYSPIGPSNNGRLNDEPAVSSGFLAANAGELDQALIAGEDADDVSVPADLAIGTSRRWPRVLCRAASGRPGDDSGVDPRPPTGSMLH